MKQKQSYTVVRRSGRKVVRRDVPTSKPSIEPNDHSIVKRGETIAEGAADAAKDGTTARYATVLGHVSAQTTIDAYSAIAEQSELVKSWADLLGLIEARTWLGTLRPFAKFCLAMLIAPADVNDEVLQRYLVRLHADGKIRWPKTTARRIAQAWNIQAETVEGWPVTTLNASSGGA